MKKSTKYGRIANIFMFSTFASLVLTCTPAMASDMKSAWSILIFTFIVMFIGMGFMIAAIAVRTKEYDELKKITISEAKDLNDDQLVEKYKSESDETLKKIYIEELVSRYDSNK